MIDSQPRSSVTLPKLVFTGVIIIFIVMGISSHLGTFQFSQKNDQSILLSASQSVQIEDAVEIVDYVLFIKNNMFELRAHSSEIDLFARGAVTIKPNEIRLRVSQGNFNGNLAKIDQSSLQRYLTVKTDGKLIKLKKLQGCWYSQELVVAFCEESHLPNLH